MISSLRRTGLLAVAVALMAACSSEPATAPTTRIAAPVAPSADLASLLASLHLVPLLQRTTPLASSITVTQTVGAEGGTLSIPAAGVTVTIPQGALSSPTVITMTARAGSALAYDFAPHGITFAKPLEFKQKLAGTNANLVSALLLNLGYYPDPSFLGGTFALVTELISGSLNLLDWSFTSKISHFSGYVIACGRDE